MSKFKAFVDNIEKIDEEIQEEEKKESMGFDIDNLDIGFMTSAEPDGGRSAASMFGFEDEESPFGNISAGALVSEHEKLVERAKEKYNKTFFKRFTYSGR